MMNGNWVGKRPMRNIQTQAQTSGGSFVQNRNSSAGISESIEHEDQASQNNQNQRTRGIGFIQNLKINSAKRPMTAKRIPQHTLIN